MKKKKSRQNSERGKQTNKAPVVPPPRVPAPDEAQNPFDFGGLPDRDLKKNLGCG